jgi:hypothetical protein
MSFPMVLLYDFNAQLAWWSRVVLPVLLTFSAHAARKAFLSSACIIRIVRDFPEAACQMFFISRGMYSFVQRPEIKVSSI